MDEMKEEDDDERGRKGEETKGVCLVFGVTVWTRRWLMGPAPLWTRGLCLLVFRICLDNFFLFSFLIKLNSFITYHLNVYLHSYLFRKILSMTYV